MKIVFFGTPEYVIPIFEYLLKKEGVICAVTRSDKPAGRHLSPAPSPIKNIAAKRNIPVLTPEDITGKSFISQLLTFKPQVAVVAAYGKILPKEVLDLFPLGCINLHFSLLPDYRGAAPIQWAIINGETETGVTSFFMDEGLDTGRIIFQKKTDINKNDDTEILREKLVPVAVSVLEETLELVRKGQKGEVQKGQPTNAPALTKSDGRIDWSKLADEIVNLIRGTKPWPGAYAEVEIGTFWPRVHSATGQKAIKLKILEAEKTSICPEDHHDCSADAKPGEITGISRNVGFVVMCAEDLLLIKKVQPENGKIMSAWSFLQGHKLAIGDKLA